MALDEESLSIGLGGRDDEEGVFSRDINGQLVRVDAPTESDYETQVSIQIDGRPVQVPLAEPLKDAQGNIVLDLQGRTTPRYTTVYDAAMKLHSQYRSESADPDAPPTVGPGGVPLADWRRFPIPILCHQAHMKAVAVCRVCMVQVYGSVGGRRRPERKLLPSCHLQVKPGMEVFTIGAPGADGDKVRRTVKVVTELLTAEHLKPGAGTAMAAFEPFNELKMISDRLDLTGSRFKNDLMTISAPHPQQRTPDESSSVFNVDRTACILCDRCWRACGEVKGNHIIGRAGKGASARIAFDLDVPMGDSGCVQCGECMVSCPTTAITFKPVAKIKAAPGQKDVEVLTAPELQKEPVLQGVPPKFLLWQEGLVVRRRLKAGDVLFREGDPGNTAFLIRSGRLEVQARAKVEKKEGGSGFFGMFGGGGHSQGEIISRFQVGPADVIVGEMACLAGTPRTADLVAVEQTEVWELRRNVLDRVMRSPTQRQRFENLYRSRALQDVLRNTPVFQGLPADEYNRCIEFLKPRLSFVRVNPGQVIFEQGDRADTMYMVRLGHIRVTIGAQKTSGAVFFRGPNTILGEIGLLSIAATDANRSVDEVDAQIARALHAANPERLSAALAVGTRSATCSALDHVELAAVRREDFLAMIREFATVRRRLIDQSLKLLRAPQKLMQDAVIGDAYRQYVNQGLYQGRSLLVLDLDNCTRCDACTQACTSQHGTETHGVPFTRLLRDGLRFGNYLVATSCRSCIDAYCMIGCPVDSIHKGKHHQIVIEDHCIGCGLCASNCPYGNIFMVKPTATSGERLAQPKAAACDLCDPHGYEDEPKPRCVYACPHDAAFRMSGPKLMKKVTGIDPQDT